MLGCILWALTLLSIHVDCETDLCHPCKCDYTSVICHNVSFSSVISKMPWNSLTAVGVSLHLSQMNDIIIGTIPKSKKVTKLLITNSSFFWSLYSNRPISLELFPNLGIIQIVNSHGVFKADKSHRIHDNSNSHISELSVSNSTMVGFSWGGAWAKKLEVHDVGLKQLVGYEQAENLDLSLNNISELPSEGESNLMYLNLSHNAFYSLLPYSFDFMHKLQILDLSWNQIGHIDIDAFRIRNDNKFLIKKIDLSHNRLRSLDSKQFPWFQQNVNLQFNPWRCSCNAQWMIDDLIHIFNLVHPENLPDIRCDSPSSLKNIPMSTWLNDSIDIFCKTRDPSDVVSNKSNAGSGVFSDFSSAVAPIIDYMNRTLAVFNRMSDGSTQAAIQSTTMLNRTLAELAKEPPSEQTSQTFGILIFFVCVIGLVQTVLIYLQCRSKIREISLRRRPGVSLRTLEDRASVQ